jgi:hypothetical protein|nr:MAG TPA: hypothetical protein [Caudoviricetes sp.]
MDYKKSYESALDSLAFGECPVCPPDNLDMDKECQKCMDSDSDTFEKRRICWNKKFTTE